MKNKADIRRYYAEKKREAKAKYKEEKGSLRDFSKSKEAKRIKNNEASARYRKSIKDAEKRIKHHSFDLINDEELFFDALLSEGTILKLYRENEQFNGRPPIGITIDPDGNREARKTEQGFAEIVAELFRKSSKAQKKAGKKGKTVYPIISTKIGEINGVWHITVKSYIPRGLKLSNQIDKFKK